VRTNLRLVKTSTPAGRFVYWPDRKPANLTDGNSRCVAYLDSLPFQEGTPLAPAEEQPQKRWRPPTPVSAPPIAKLSSLLARCRDPQGRTLTVTVKISQQTSCLPMHPQKKPTTIRTPDVNATESGTNGIDISVRPYPYGISQRLLTKWKARCTQPQSSACDAPCF
jgi:hypothetical protein